MSDLLVIMGAGASFDALRSDQERPPLASQLFDTSYDGIQRQFPAVDRLRDTIQTRMSEGRTIENILGTFVASPSPDLQAQVFQIPVYLKSLLGQFTAARPGMYDSLITLIQERELKATFVTLNYDTLLDEAIERAYSIDTPIQSIESYIDRSGVRNWNYIKLHGSVNWGHVTSISHTKEGDWPGYRTSDTSMQEYLAVIDVHRRYGTHENDGNIVLLDENDALVSDGRFVYPALAIPTDRKNEVMCPADHLGVLRSALQSDPAVLVVGNQGLDADLMGVLEESAVRGSKTPFRVVDPDDNGKPRSRFARALGRSRFSIQPAAQFREFVESGAAERFLDEVRDATGTTGAVIDPYRL